MKKLIADKIEQNIFQCYPDDNYALPSLKKDYQISDLSLYLKGKLKKYFKGSEGLESAEKLLSCWDIDRFGITYNMLSDTKSKDQLVDILAFKMLSHKNYKLQFPTEHFYELLKNINKCKTEETINPNNWILYLYDLSKIGKDIKVFFHDPESVYLSILANQYGYPDADFDIKKGDYVIDGGCFYGDTALVFANKTGAIGKVFSFEFVNDNIKVFENNMRVNPELSKSISLNRYALWNSSDETLTFQENGPATRVDNSKTSPTISVKTKSIDDFVKEKNIEKIDFIKLDIEGAEMKCLEGAQNTIKKYKPKLAICVYHKDYDMVEIPQYIKQLLPEYKLFLKHHTTSYGETVLYCKV
jgi:FkbM family methyltransferase